MNQIKYTITAESEDTDFVGNCIASGDDDFDRACEDDIRRQLESGNVWAWCVVKVSAHFEGFTGNAYLGACSYASEKDFLECDYYASMRVEARTYLRIAIEKACEQGEVAKNALTTLKELE